MNRFISFWHSLVSLVARQFPPATSPQLDYVSSRWALYSTTDEKPRPLPYRSVFVYITRSPVPADLAAVFVAVMSFLLSLPHLHYQWLSRQYNYRKFYSYNSYRIANWWPCTCLTNSSTLRSGNCSLVSGLAGISGRLVAVISGHTPKGSSMSRLKWRDPPNWNLKMFENAYYWRGKLRYLHIIYVTTSVTTYISEYRKYCKC